MQVNNETQTGFAGEIKIVPLWAWVLAGIVFVAAQIFFNVVVARHGGGPPVWARPLLGLRPGLAGDAISCSSATSTATRNGAG